MLYIPPILRNCSFAGLEHGESHTHLVFISNDPIVDGGVVRVAVTLRGSPLYVYSLYDPQSETVVHYEGRFGDPSKDKATDMKGTND